MTGLPFCLACSEFMKDLALNASQLAELAARNRALAAKRHAPRRSERIRDALLRGIAKVPTWQARRADPNTFLLIRPDHIGDAVLSMPAIRALRAAQPQARLIVLCGAWSAEVFAAYPEVDQVVTLPFPGFGRSRRRGALWRPYWQAWRAARQVRHIEAGIALILRPDHWWGALLAKWAGIPKRVGYDLPNVAPFLTHTVPYREAHCALENAALIAEWTGGQVPQDLSAPFPFTEEDTAYVRSLLGEDAKRYAVIHVGAGSAYKTWTAENWAYVADQLVEKLGVAIALTGSEREHAAAAAISAHIRRTAAYSLLGETNLSQLAALYAGAVVVLGADTGPLHIAVSVGAPSVHLFGPSDPMRFGPWGNSARHAVLAAEIACRPCRILDWAGDDAANHPCLSLIRREAVLSAALRVARR
ncbi:MAG: glycosyltransferase family 9 protein [Chloroflexota bacterium]|nr:MAG: glycosyltransferase family 9 protein [Chloroflexota bacterium]